MRRSLRDCNLLAARALSSSGSNHAVPASRRAAFALSRDTVLTCLLATLILGGGGGSRMDDRDGSGVEGLERTDSMSRLSLRDGVEGGLSKSGA